MVAGCGPYAVRCAQLRQWSHEGGAAAYVAIHQVTGQDDQVGPRRVGAFHHALHVGSMVDGARVDIRQHGHTQAIQGLGQLRQVHQLFTHRGRLQALRRAKTRRAQRQCHGGAGQPPAAQSQVPCVAPAHERGGPRRKPCGITRQKKSNDQHQRAQHPAAGHLQIGQRGVIHRAGLQELEQQGRSNAQQGGQRNGH